MRETWLIRPYMFINIFRLPFGIRRVVHRVNRTSVLLNILGVDEYSWVRGCFRASFADNKNIKLDKACVTALNSRLLKKLYSYCGPLLITHKPYFFNVNHVIYTQYRISISMQKWLRNWLMKLLKFVSKVV